MLRVARGRDGWVAEVEKGPREIAKCVSESARLPRHKLFRRWCSFSSLPLALPLIEHPRRAGFLLGAGLCQSPRAAPSSNLRFAPAWPDGDGDSPTRVSSPGSCSRKKLGLVVGQTARCQVSPGWGEAFFSPSFPGGVLEAAWSRIGSQQFGRLGSPASRNYGE